jgi:thiosulfate dehydrogenase [quinone] large subunit
MSKFDEFRSNKAVRHWPIILLRVYTGVFFTYFGFRKISGGNFAEGLGGFVGSQLENSAGFIRPFLESVVLPNKGLFAFLVSWGELAIGIALIVGFATRWAGIAGAVMVAAFWATKGQGLLDAQNHDAVWFVIFVVLAGLHAGRVMGVDEKLATRFRFLA